MGDFPRSFTDSPLPSVPSSSSDKSNLVMLYYGLVVVGIATIGLALYNITIIRRRHMQSQQPAAEVAITTTTSSSIDIENYSQRSLLSFSSFKYKKETGKEVVGNGYDDDYECPVCLSGYEEGEEVRKLPRCKHSFHAPCIDMWLYSHFDCPICRTPIGPFFSHRSPPPESSRPGLMESGGVSV